MKRHLHTAGREGRARIKDALARELAGYNDIAFAYLFGSAAESESFHDVDVGVYLRDTHSQSAGLALALAQRLSDRLGLPVDVRILNAAPVPFLYRALRGELLLSADDELLADVIETTVQRYLDIEPLLRRGAKEAYAA